MVLSRARAALSVRFLGWSTAVLLWAVPAIAMRFSDEVRWTGLDFAIWGGLLAVVGLALEFTARRTSERAYQVAVGVTLGAKFLLLWMAGAVGILDGADGWLLGGVFLAGTVGALIARFRPAGMAWSLVATACPGGGGRRRAGARHDPCFGRGCVGPDGLLLRAVACVRVAVPQGGAAGYFRVISAYSALIAFS
jgi:hypothetical protein